MSFDRELAAREALAGNQAYLSGDYAAAISAYDAALGAGVDSADLWFNLGNACYRAGQHGRAALAFERALRRDPGDAEARANLELVRAQVARAGASSRPLPFVARVGARIDPDLASGVLLLTWILACALVLARMRRAWSPAPRLALGIAAAVLLAGSALAGAATWATAQVRGEGWSVVVSAGDAREAPDPGAKVAFPVQEALALRATSTVGRFTRVELPGGPSGWLETEKLERIDAPPR
ncbi:tetratricopeptide repeat protein [Vulgatibacter incomptus]|uniref:BatE n=1 Tax=Vulgatibacter incomptus TaxID=1391653 RepID=A0A0K1P996_9BACT|nr:tetratricopeptide repeat protein [Vulgatibacter incomptus]AKU89991.1 BatE [Vulgatibacter incomptus]